jgi:hypothetical protein
MRFLRLTIVALAAVLAAPCTGWAAGGEAPFIFDLNIRLLGADLGVGYRGARLLPGVDTTIWTYLGGGYEWLTYYRDPSGELVSPGSLGAGGALSGYQPVFGRIEGAWAFGIDQGLAWNPRTGTNLVEAFLFYRGRLDSNQIAQGELLYASSLPDRAGVFLNTILSGFGFNDVLNDNRHKVRSGLSAELSAEWGPRFFFNTLVGDSDFLRLNATLRWFLPLFDLAPDRPVNLLSVYLGEFASLDYSVAFGAPVPLYIRQTFGGRYAQQPIGLGLQVRGVDPGAYDTNLKAVNNLELRFNLPAIVLPDMVPGAVLYWDIGCYDQVGESGVLSPPAWGIVTTTGIGVTLDFLDLATGAAYLTWRLDAPNADGTVLGFDIEFSLHF